MFLNLLMPKWSRERRKSSPWKIRHGPNHVSWLEHKQNRFQLPSNWLSKPLPQRPSALYCLYTRACLSPTAIQACPNSKLVLKSNSQTYLISTKMLHSHPPPKRGVTPWSLQRRKSFWGLPLGRSLLSTNLPGRGPQYPIIYHLVARITNVGNYHSLCQR